MGTRLNSCIDTDLLAELLTFCVHTPLTHVPSLSIVRGEGTVMTEEWNRGMEVDCKVEPVDWSAE